MTTLANLLGLPVEASAHAGQIDTITVLVHVLMLALFLGWGGYFIWVLVRFRSRRNPRANYQPVRSRFSTYSEAVIVLAELILLGFFSFNKQAFCNYYFFVIGAICCAIAATKREAPPPKLDAGPSLL